MLAIFTDTFFVFGLFVGIAFSALACWGLYQKILRHKIKDIYKSYRISISNLQQEIQRKFTNLSKEIEELAEYRKNEMQKIVDKSKEDYEWQLEELEFKEAKFLDITKKLEKLYSNIENESEKVKLNINELHRLREKHEKIVATNRQLNERLTRKKRQLQNLKGGKEGENQM